MIIIITIYKYFLNILVFTKIFGFLDLWTFILLYFWTFDFFTYKKRIEKAMALKWLQVD